MNTESKWQLTEVPDSSSSTSSSSTSSHPSALSLSDLVDSSDTIANENELNTIIPEQSTAIDDSKRTSNSRHVSFDSVHVHEHPVILGCNPGVRALPSGPGPAFTLSWESSRSSDYNMDDFEAQRQLTRRPRDSLRKTKTERVQTKMAEDAIRHIHTSREASAQEKSDLSAMLLESKKRQEEKRKKETGQCRPQSVPIILGKDLVASLSCVLPYLGTEQFYIQA